MTQPSADPTRKIFLILTADPKKQQYFEKIIRAHISPSVIYTATDGLMGSSKIKNDPPHVLITDEEIQKLKGSQVVDTILKDPKLKSIAIIFSSPLPQQEKYLDSLVTGRIQYLAENSTEENIRHCIMRSLNYGSAGTESDFSLRYLPQGDRLIEEGQEAKCVFIVKKGKLRAFSKLGTEEVTLGYIEKGEFIGEMAYIHKAPHSAVVEAITDCELIEIPLGTLDRVLYERPAWARSLMVTLSKRIQKANLNKLTSQK